MTWVKNPVDLQRGEEVCKVMENKLELNILFMAYVWWTCADGERSRSMPYLFHLYMTRLRFFESYHTAANV